ncbi:eukaryotic translation initiation factor 5B-like [Punica granatum]|uniref:Eukaryotic translation initiation factor 5B n=2 Tax=Punica granatum TaxID=22663 RepID=A0A218XK28_PUNGR|nr:eukaryotic translation initiation factor 5B-like [Punica granatum]XP_031376206.1 eukaryotic translation initiation factor 5B-like [Punica granatum]XP_031394876.1 eukaryotic translation initiation factor 5B-like [Punica granatum]XP_031394877.1 eukaryotic translation initiation factor 5B-like [Punica granatum]OWM85049.1 hypothetical protein CDL15_Pgr027836 [Punica granatum]
MGRKKPTARDDDNPAPAAKSKKKAVVIDDDEYSVGTELSEEREVPEEPVVITGKNKGKKGTSKAQQPKEEEEDVEMAVEEDDAPPPAVFTGKKKGMSKKGGGGNAFAGFGLLGDEGEDEEDEEDEEEASVLTAERGDSEEEEAPAISFSGKKKKSSKKGSKGEKTSFTASGFGALDDDDEVDEGAVVDSDHESKPIDDNGDEPVIAFTGKKKPSKGGKKGGAGGFSALGQEEEEKEADEDEEVDAVTFSGKKKKSSKTSKKSDGHSFTASGFGALGEEDEEEKEKEDEDEEISNITFTGKKKKKSSKASKKSGGNSFSAADFADEGSVEDYSALEAPSAIHETVKDEGKKKEDVVETAKNKKKKKKSGRTAQEEDDLDKILAELGGGPSVSKPVEPLPKEEKVDLQPEPVTQAEPAAEKVGEEEHLESAAAKKKKKKKEKEKEKKAAAAAAVDEKPEEPKATAEPKKNEAKGKAADKKVSRQVREMQEALARRKEAEERKKREEEEKQRKEEEERRRQEELERQAEEARRRKKEKEKEKLLKKKQEGKLLTAKQKEEARRLAAMREQILANANLPSAGDTGSAQAKRPIYQTKKSKQARQQANGAAPVKEVESDEPRDIQQETVSEADSMEPEKIEEVELVNAEEKSEVGDAEEENGMAEDEDEDEWDAKSWDDVNISVKSSFAEEEADSEPEKVAKKERKGAVAVPPAATKLSSAPKKVVPSEHVKSEEVKKTQPEAEVGERNKTKGTAPAKAGPGPSPTPKPSGEKLRSPICCIMGHVDTGKTKLLDCIRGTNVQEGEAGGITQQIGATYFPAENIRERTKELKADATLKVPGLLVIDTPGHESFTNLRSRGSGLCDIAILVVDIMHGLEPQTIESLNLLKMRNTEFIVALNKVDRLYGWKTCNNAPIVKAMKQQTKDVQNEFNMRLIQIITQFKEQGLNTELYYKNKEMGETFSIVPTSAISGEGIPDLLLLLVQWSQKTMVEKLTYIDEIQCTVLEVKVVEGHGTTIDVVLVNGVLHEGDQIVVCGLQGPIVTTIRALLTPHPMKELRVKGTYLHHKEIKAAQGIKISAQGLEHAIAGTGLYVVGPDDDIEDVKEAAMEDMKSVMSRIDKTGEGVCVQASTLGSLEALLEFLKSPAVSIPVSGISIGPVHKKDVMRASVMLEKKKEFATILAFDVKVTPEARELSEELGVKIFMADIIYHLFDQFKAYIDNIKEEKKKEAADEAVFPCVLKIIPNCVFNKKDPIVLGVDVLEGIAKVGTPICIPQREFIDIGRIASIENNKKPVDTAKKGQKVAIKIVGSNPEEQQKMYGRHFDLEDELVSHISRRSIDILKTNYRDDLSIEEWKLVVKLKSLFKIQ